MFLYLKVNIVFTSNHILYNIQKKITEERIYLGVIFVIPLIMFFDQKSEHLFYSMGRDAHYYLAYFHGYFDGLTGKLVNYYKISRASWVIPGAVIYNLFNYKLAHAVLTLGTLYFTFYSLYYLIRELFDSFTGILTTVLLIFYTFLYGIGGWNYHINIAIAYLLLSIFFLIKSTRTEKYFKYTTFLGMSFFSASLCLPFIALFLPFLALAYVLSLNQIRLIHIRNLIIGSFLGFLIIFCLSQLVHSTLGYKGYFIEGIIRITTSLAKENAWFFTLKDTYKHPVYRLTFAFIPITIFLSFYSLKKMSHDRGFKNIFNCCLCFGGGLISFLVLYLMRMSILYPRFFLIIIPFLFMVIGATLYLFFHNKKLSYKQKIIYLITISIVFYSRFYISPENLLYKLSNILALTDFELFLIMTFVFSAILTVFLVFKLKRTRWSLVTILIFFYILYAFASPIYRDPDGFKKNGYYAMFKSMKILSHLNLKTYHYAQKNYIAYDTKKNIVDDKDYKYIFRTAYNLFSYLNILMIERHCCVNTLNFPNLVEKNTIKGIKYKLPKRDFKLIILRTNKTDTKTARNSLTKLNRKSKLLHSFLISENTVKFHMDILQVSAKKI